MLQVSQFGQAVPSHSLAPALRYFISLPRPLELQLMLCKIGDIDRLYHLTHALDLFSLQQVCMNLVHRIPIGLQLKRGNSV